MKLSRYNVMWHEKNIEVVISDSFAMRKIVIYVDGTEIMIKNQLAFMTRYFYSAVIADGEKKYLIDLVLSMGMKDKKPGCHIYIEKELVGGDTDKALVHKIVSVDTMIEYYAQKMEKGYFYFVGKYILTTGVLFSAVLTAFDYIDKKEMGNNVVITFIGRAVMFGVVMGILKWNNLSKEHKNLIERKKKEESEGSENTGE